METGDDSSQVSRQDTPTRNPGSQSKRRKTDEVTMLAATPMTSAAKGTNPEIEGPKQHESRAIRRRSAKSVPIQKLIDPVQPNKSAAAAVSEEPANGHQSNSRRRSRAAADHANAATDHTGTRQQVRRRSPRVVIETPARPAKENGKIPFSPQAEDLVDVQDEESGNTSTHDLITRLKSMVEEAKSLQLSQQREEAAFELALQLQREITKAGRRGRD